MKRCRKNRRPPWRGGERAPAIGGGNVESRVPAQTQPAYGAAQAASRTTGPHHFRRRPMRDAFIVNVAAAPSKIVTPIAAGAVAVVLPTILDPTCPAPSGTIVFHTSGGDHGALRPYSGTSGRAFGVQRRGRTSANPQRTGGGDDAAEGDGCSLRNSDGGGLAAGFTGDGGAGVAPSSLGHGAGLRFTKRSRFEWACDGRSRARRRRAWEHSTQRRQDKSADRCRPHVIGWISLFAAPSSVGCRRFLDFAEELQRSNRHQDRCGKREGG